MPDDGPRGAWATPEGWTACPRMSEPFAGMFLASKAPLREQFYADVPREDWYTPDDALALAQSKGRAVAMVIDLTNTSRYYDASDFEKYGVRVYKIRCAGRDGAPAPREVSEFVYAVQRCAAEMASDPGWQEKARQGYAPTILVHCTHGFNRTGAMLTHYCQRARGWPELNKWVTEFAKVRPPGIYKSEYLESLFDYYLERRFSTTKDPKVPAWKSDDLSDAPPLTDDKVPAGDLFDPRVNLTYKKTLAHSRAPIPGTRRALQRAMEIAEVESDAGSMHHEDVVGEEVYEEMAHEIRKLCVWAVMSDDGASGRVDNFPGSQPVSLSRNNMELLKREPYSVTWKADGTRYLLMLMRDGTYLIDRKFAIRRVQMRFPLPHKKFGTNVHHCTLMDGEMVVDTDPQTKKQTRRYLAYDLMAINGERVTQRPFLERLNIVREFVVEPRKAFLAQAGPSGAYAAHKEPFSVRTKEFFPLNFARSFIEKFIPALSHESDGLIFQPSNVPYVPQTYEALLKWKFPELNSVDFLLRVSRDKGLLFVGQKGGALARLEDDFVTHTDPLESLDGKIVECTWDMNEKTWVFLRTRSDKDTPNFITTYEKTWKSIQDNITSNDILEFVEKEVVTNEGATTV
jgi:mRNA-capping enzyme